MSTLVFRKATDEDIDEINQLQVEIFNGEQNIPPEEIPLSGKAVPQWWCALQNGSVVGAVAAWQEHDQTHWGRFITRPDCRGMQIGTRLARFSFDELFSQQIEEVYMDARDATVKIICRLGGQIIGEPYAFFEGTVTPVVLRKEDYLKNVEA